MNLEYRPTARSRPLFTSISIYFRAVLLTLRTWTLEERCALSATLPPWSALSWRSAETGFTSDPAKCSRRPRECSSARWPEGEQGRARPVAMRARGFRRFNSMRLCEGADGQHCTFLASTSRKHLPHILQKLRYRGACAELASGEATTPR